jgi:hypothetical protein
MQNIDIQELPIIPIIEIDKEVEAQISDTILDSLQTQIFEAFEREQKIILKIKIVINPSSKNDFLDIEVHTSQNGFNAVAISLPTYLCFLPIISTMKVNGCLRLIFQSRKVSIKQIKKTFKNYHK